MEVPDGASIVYKTQKHMSFFSSKSDTSATEQTNDLFHIRTMQDDLDALEGASPEEETLSFSQETPTQDIPVQSPQNFSPGQNPFISEEPETQPSQTPMAFMDQNPEVYANSIEISEEPHSPKIMVVIIILTLLVFLGGAYYFFTTRTITDTAPVEEQGAQQKQTMDDKQSALSENTPNYLPIDTKNATQETFLEIFSETARRVAASGYAAPVEFFITDKDNTPIPFSTFASLSGLRLSPKLLGALDDKFSLFIYTEDSVQRMGLSIALKDTSAIKNLLIQEEPKLPEALTPLFLNNKPVSTGNAAYQETFYQGVPLRYINFDPTATLSVDYAITDTALVFATSKNTARALLDTLSK